MRVRFLEIAEIELDDAVQWYGAQGPGLGNAFLIEVPLCSEPHRALSSGMASARRRRSSLPPEPLPFGLIYTIENNDILMLAVAHLDRQPDYWRNRLTQ